MLFLSFFQCISNEQCSLKWICYVYAIRIEYALYNMSKSWVISQSDRNMIISNLYSIRLRVIVLSLNVRVWAGVVVEALNSTHVTHEDGWKEEEQQNNNNANIGKVRCACHTESEKENERATHTRHTNNNALKLNVR